MTTADYWKVTELKVDPRTTRDTHVEYAKKRKDRLKFDLERAFERNKPNGIMAQLDAVNLVVEETREQTQESHVSNVSISIEAAAGPWKFYCRWNFEPKGK